MPTSRPFETMACGTFLLTWAELSAPFVEGEHYARYDGPGDLANKLERYLTDERLRESIAAAGCSLVNREFSSERMWSEVLC
jgi:spore maturation protein CgeB